MDTTYTIRREDTGQTMAILVTRARGVVLHSRTALVTGTSPSMSRNRTAEVLRFWRQLVTIAPADYELTRERR
jgi:hypothetical protein